MAEGAKKLEGEPFDVSNVTRPTSFQRNLENRVAEEVGKRRTSVRPGPLAILPAASETTKPVISAEMRARVKALFDELGAMKPDERAPYRESVRQTDPDLFQAMHAVVEEFTEKQRLAAIANRASFQDRVRMWEESHRIVEQAWDDTQKEYEDKLKKIG